ncbi:MAG TPA: anaerobic ribonucleoside-triphosphate reductase, partial [Candidatus Binatus sp.]|nr:anaerobic ribonucleoside-triphosphate reductase [Candidatus Binatus sp.]
KDSLPLVKKIVESAKKVAEEVDAVAPGLRIHVGFHSSPEASSRFAEVDSEKYGYSTVVYQGSKKFPYYTDQPALPATRRIPLDKRLTIEGEIQGLIDGDSLLPLDISRNVNPNELSRLSKRIVDEGTRHFTYTRTVSSCLNCHTTEARHRTRCENCGSDRIMNLGRCSGRILPLEMWPPARIRDLDRTVEYEA